MELDKKNNDRSYLWGRFFAASEYAQPSLHKTHYRNFQLHPFSLVMSVHDIVMQANNEDAEREIRAIMDLFDVDDYSDDSPVDKNQFWLGYRLQKLDFARPYRLIAKKRKEKGLTQSQLADMVGMGLRNVQKLENGQHRLELVKLKNADKLAKALGLDINDLVWYDDDVPTT